MPYEFRFRRGVASTWAVRNPVLGPGEPGLESDTGKYKIGNGTTRWNLLPYYLDSNGVEELIEEASVEGPPGKSAYEVAVQNGFVGSQSAWLASLIGPAGADGEDGEDGADGQPGSDGADGLSAYEVALADGFVGDQTAWLASLVGPAGANGTNGTNGVDGTDGADGADGESVTVTLVPAASWPPAADSNPLHLYFRVP